MSEEKNESVEELRSAFFSADDSGREMNVEIDGREYLVKEMTVGEQLDTISLPEGKNGKAASARSIARVLLCTYDPETDERVFDSSHFDVLRDAKSDLKDRLMELISAVGRVNPMGNVGRRSEKEKKS